MNRRLSGVLAITAVLCGGTGALGQNAVTSDLLSDLDGVSLPPGTLVTYQVTITVTGDNQGLANYTADMTIKLAGDTDPNSDGTFKYEIPKFTFTQSFNIGGNGPAGVNAGSAAGGPGMNFAITGTSQNGRLAGFSAGYTPPWNSDSMTPGVGRAGGDGLPGLGVVPIFDGTIDTTGFVDGVYTLTLEPGSTGLTVLRPDVDLTQPVSGNFATSVTAAAAEDSITFTVDVNAPPPGQENDADADGVLDPDDNCPNDPNPDQADSNGNGIGDACEQPPAGPCGTGVAVLVVPLMCMLMLMKRRVYARLDPK